MTALKAPFPYFGGKSAIASEVWRRFGNVSNYVEPFFGSGAVLLGRPHWRKDGPRLTETVNDADGLLANFWRAMTDDPDAVAHHAEWPVNEADLHARHLWLVGERERITERLMGDPAFYDAKAAGWWVWGACAWIGSGYCSGKGPWVTEGGVMVRGSTGLGINRQLPHLGSTGLGISRQLPHLGCAGRGINRQLPHLGSTGQGINRQLPHLGSTGQGINRQPGRAAAHLAPLAGRLRDVRVACGDWSRVLGAAIRPMGGPTCGIFLDPPYGEGFGAAYATTGSLATEASIAADAWAWAIENGGNPALRICVAGYEDGRTVPDGWRTVAWDASMRPGGAGYGNASAGEANAKRETLWFSPHCLDPDAGQMALL